MEKLSYSILTISDSCSQGKAIDTSGPHLETLVRAAYPSSSLDRYEIIPDDFQTIVVKLMAYSDQTRSNVIFTVGGTGFGARDTTPEATRHVVQKLAPQLAMVMALISIEKTKFAALSRAVCGIRNETLIVNLPGSQKAVAECFPAISDIIPHAVQLICNDLTRVRCVHDGVQKSVAAAESKKSASSGSGRHSHVCPHKTGAGDDNDRNSPYPMVSVDNALAIVLDKVQRNEFGDFASPIDLPPFRASIKDGYAMKAGSRGEKKVLGYISAGDEIIATDFLPDECYKINTGAAVPDHADCVVQVEDTKVVRRDESIEKVVNILIEPTANLDIRPIGCDLQKGELLFGSKQYAGNVAAKSLCASTGHKLVWDAPTIGIISTGDELVDPGEELRPGKIYDSNMTMLAELLLSFGVTKIKTNRVKDSYESLSNALRSMTNECEITICSGGVSMGDKDFVKSVCSDLGLTIHFGRVNMKPGKPMTFASDGNRSVFGLPGNPVSAFVTFHLFVLPAIRARWGFSPEKYRLATINVELINDEFLLDPRPEYARAMIISRSGKLYAQITGDQISSRLKSIHGADVLLHLPGKTSTQPSISKGSILTASVLKADFISKYE